MDTQNPPDEDLDLLDLLLTFAENWKLLIFGPLLVGIAALGISFVIPQTYSSNSSVQVDTDEKARFSGPVAASLAMSADVLEKIAPIAGLDSSLSAEEIREKLAKRISVSVGKQDKLLSIVTQGSSPEAAQTLNQALLETLLPLSKPRGLDKEQLEDQIASEKERLEEAMKLEHETSARLASGQSISEATSRLYGELLAANSNRKRSILGMEQRLAGLNQDAIVQTPTLPRKAIKPKKSLIAIGAAVGMGFILLLFVFIRQALRAAKESSPEQAEKISRIRSAMPW